MPVGPVSTPDARIIKAKPPDHKPIDAFGRPIIEGVGHIKLSEGVAYRLRECLQEDPTELVQLIGRSGHAQVGLDVTTDPTEIDIEGTEVHLPLRVTSTRSDESWLQAIIEHEPNVGRLVMFDGCSPLNAEQVNKAIEAQEIYVPKGQYEILEDGTLSVSLDPITYLLTQYLFKQDEDRILQVLKNGRRALTSDLQDYVDGCPEPLNPHDLFVGGIRFSTGKYSALIDRSVQEDLEHLSALYLDAIRSTGTDRRLGRTRVRQVELLNTGRKEIYLEAIQIKLRLFEVMDNPLATTVAGVGLKRLHAEGITFAETTDLENDNVRSGLFAVLAMPNTYGGIFTKAGGSRVPAERTTGLQIGLIEEIIKNEPADLPGYDELSNRISLTRDQGTLLVTDELPNAFNMQKLGQSGIRAFLFRNTAPQQTDGQSRVYLSGAQHEQMLELSKRYRVAFNFEIHHPDNGVDFRLFYRGFWLSPENINKFRKVRTVVAMYGSAVDGLDEYLKKDLEELAISLKEHFGDEVAFCHGKGPGFMMMADKAARSNDLMSIGVGIDVEKIGQAANLLPQAIVDFDSDQRHYRQNLLDTISLCRIFNIGGAGTTEEIAMAMCNLKLGETIPAPLIFVDPTKGKRKSSKHLWDDIIAQYFRQSGKKTFNINGTKVKMDKSLLNKWAPKCMHRVRSYAEAADIIIKFAQDPESYWKSKGIPKEQIERAIPKHRDRIMTYLEDLPDFILNLNHGTQD